LYSTTVFMIHLYLRWRPWDDRYYVHAYRVVSRCIAYLWWSC